MADLKIVQRGRKILNVSSKWNRSDTRVCPPDAKTFRLYCAREKATSEVSGDFKRRAAAIEKARFVIDQIAFNRNNYQHRRMDHNNDPATTFADAQPFFRHLERRMAKELDQLKAP